MCMADYADDRPTVYSAKTFRTRKDRRCDECGRLIKQGERYENAFMVYEGHGSTFVTCEHCKVGAQWLLENCGGYLHNAVWADLEEHIAEYPTLAFELSRLRVGRKRLWQRFDGAGLMAIPPVPRTLEEAGLEKHG
jgi:hypothetical protein